MRVGALGAGLGLPLMAALTAELFIGPALDGTGTEARLTFDLQSSGKGTPDAG